MAPPPAASPQQPIVVPPPASTASTAAPSMVNPAMFYSAAMNPMQMAAFQQQMMAMSLGRGMPVPAPGSPVPMFAGAIQPPAMQAPQAPRVPVPAPSPSANATRPPQPQPLPQQQPAYVSSPPMVSVPMSAVSATVAPGGQQPTSGTASGDGTPPIDSSTDAQLAGFKVVDSGRPDLASQDPDVAFLAGSAPTQWSDMPFSVTPGTKLSFGLGSRQAPVDHEISETITITNTTSHKQSFRLLPKTSAGKFQIRFEPSGEGKLAAGKTATVDIKLTVLCTSAQLRLEIPLVAWRGEAEKAKRLVANLTSEMESQLTTKLDSDELTIFTPAVGDGSFGTVYRGEYRGLEVAIKLLKFQQAITPDMMDGFRSEVEMMEKLRHPCIINFIGAVHTPGHMAIVTEFCNFGNLNGAMKKHKFSLGLKLKSLLDTARGMDFLHRSSILHRDLKPDNILMTSLEMRAGVVCKISDFGTTRDINRFSAEMHYTKGVGTPIFMAPEVLQGKSSYERSADVYSFALMMANLAEEKMPFEDDPEIKSSWQFASLVIAGKRPIITAAMPEEYIQLMTRCWSAIPAERPSFSDIVPKIDAMFKRELQKSP